MNIFNLFKKSDYKLIIKGWRSICLFNNIDKTIYYYESNKYDNFTSYEEYISGCKIMSSGCRTSRLTKDEYEKFINNISYECNCEAGNGKPKIVVSKRYNLEEEYNNSQNEYYIEEVDSINNEVHFHLYITECISTYIAELTLYSNNMYYRQKACLQCGTCLDERQKLIEYVQIKIDACVNKIKKKQDDIKKVKEICEGI